MSDYSSYTERDAFNEALCNLVEEYLQEKDARSTDTVLAVNTKTNCFSKCSFNTIRSTIEE